MEHYETEEQQVEAIKRFWKENGTAIIVGAVLGLGGLWGWRYYNDEQIAAKEQASAAFESQTAALLAEDANFGQAKQYIDENSDTGYALLMAFQLAQQAIDRKDLSEAEKQLEFAAANSQNEAVNALANLRLARVQLALEQPEKALVSAENITTAAFSAQQQEIKGDIYVKQEMFDKARSAYSAAVAANSANTVVKMKLDNLALAANG
ncbi:tetratricopeptide repeat protein [Paraglaciecola chathamensis]|jgi:predicted negative regulator of RcsB-dependent stress response|uniref:Ancillary SecYEG translocon subunit n=1 Tax=Paraglaciecola chathamensis TaxID=368405 RepID=A0ABS0W966_9ALTE|nr:tetratricopeptide repeat protein [Paraglaciecola chathamensis]MBJ2135325.1 tetratricopeptide repeat protein [Paraglaciecola chathamensis]MDO6838122.1 tetratricopeptide repeat protein [Paraglaciecola chathamensis]